MCETSASVEYFLDGCLGKSVCLCALVYVSIACPEGRNGSGRVTPTQRETSRTRCVWGNTVVPELPSPPQRARPFHSHSIQTQASPFHLSRGVLRAITLVFFGWTICSSLSSSFGVWTACSADSLVQNQSFRHWHRKPSRFTATGFLIHSSCPIAMDSWKFEIHWTWTELHWFDCSISGVFSSGRRGVLGDFPGLCKILHETTLLGCPSCIPVFFPYFCRYRFVLAVLHVEDGSYWSTMVSDCSLLGGRDLILHDGSAES